MVSQMIREEKTVFDLKESAFHCWEATWMGMEGGNSKKKKKKIIIFILKTHEQPWVVHGARKNVMSVK